MIVEAIPFLATVAPMRIALHDDWMSLRQMLLDPDQVFFVLWSWLGFITPTIMLDLQVVQGTLNVVVENLVAHPTRGAVAEVDR